MIAYADLVFVCMVACWVCYVGCFVRVEFVVLAVGGRVVGRQFLLFGDCGFGGFGCFLLVVYLFGCLRCLIGLIIDTVCWLQCFVVLDCVIVCLFSGYEYCVGSVG